MTDPITPAEAAAAAAIDANLAAQAPQSASGTSETNGDLLGDNPTDEQIAAAAEHARQLETQLATIRAAKAAHAAPGAQGIPHAVPAAAVHQATDKPVVHAAPAVAKPQQIQLVNGKPVVPGSSVAAASTTLETAPVSHSSKLAALQAAGKATPKKKLYAYQRNRK